MWPLENGGGGGEKGREKREGLINHVSQPPFSFHRFYHL